MGSADDTPTVKVLDVPMPLPHFKEPNMDPNVPGLCRENILWGLQQDEAVGRIVWQLSWEERACWTARVMRICAKIRMQEYLADLHDNGITPWSNDPHGRALNGLIGAATMFGDVICPKDTARVDEAYRAWERVAIIQPKGGN